MEIGVLYDFRNPVEGRVPTADLYAQTLEHIEEIERLGFDTVWVTEHHFIDDEYLPSVMTMAAAVAMRTQRVTIGTGVLLLPLHHPLRVAEDAAVVDNLAEGRLRLGLGIGYKEDEFDAFAVDRRHRPSLMEEGVSLLRDAWSGEPIRHQGRHWNIDGVDVTPKPHRSGGPELWLAGRALPPVDRAARIGDGLIATGDDANIYPYFRDQWANHGRSGPPQMCTFAYTYPTDDPERARAELGPYASYRFSNYSNWYGSAGDLEMDRRWKAHVDARGGDVNADRYFDTPDAVAAQLRALEAAGVTAVLFFGTLPGLAPEQTLPLFETIAKEVRPALSRPDDGVERSPRRRGGGTDGAQPTQPPGS